MGRSIDMALNRRSKVSIIDVLQIDYEYCTISYYVEGSRNELGELNRTLTQRATNVKCSIDPIDKIPNYVRQSSLRELVQQGIIEQSAYIVILSANQTIEAGDVITDYDSTIYDVIHVINWYTHKEALLRKVN